MTQGGGMDESGRARNKRTGKAKKVWCRKLTKRKQALQWQKLDSGNGQSVIRRGEEMSESSPGGLG